MFDWLFGEAERRPPRDVGAELVRQIEELEKDLDHAGRANSALLDVVARLEKQLDRAKLVARFHKQVSGVYRRRWEAAARPGDLAPSAERKAAREGEAKVAAAINARSVPGDAESARHLRAYADRRVAEMMVDGKGEVDYETVATEILDGEEDDE